MALAAFVVADNPQGSRTGKRGGPVAGAAKLQHLPLARFSADFRNRVYFPAEIVARRGSRVLMDIPKVVVGTIHSVKGGQADVVYLFPDLSQAGDASTTGAARHVIGDPSLLCVGLTRARETLYICQRETGMAVTI